MSKALEISISLSYLSVFLYILKLFLLSYSEFVFYNNAREVKLKQNTRFTIVNKKKRGKGRANRH